MNLSTQITDFLRSHIHAVWQLEVLLFVKRRETAVSAADVAFELYLSPDAVEKALIAFAQDGILRSSKTDPLTFIYAPSNSALDDGLEQTATAYAERKFAVINLIFTNRSQFRSDSKGAS